MMVGYPLVNRYCLMENNHTMRQFAIDVNIHEIRHFALSDNFTLCDGQLPFLKDKPSNYSWAMASSFAIRHVTRGSPELKDAPRAREGL